MTLSIAYNGWDSDGNPFAQLYEGETFTDAVGSVTLDTPDTDDAEAYSTLLVGTAHGHVFAVQPQLYNWGGVPYGSPAFPTSGGSSYPARSYDVVCTIGTGSTTSNVVLSGSQTPFNGGDGLDGIPVVVLYKNSGTGETAQDSYTWEVRISTGATWNTDHWEVALEQALTTAPSNGDYLLIGGVTWQYDLWDFFSPGSVQALEAQAWIYLGIPDGQTSVIQVLELPLSDARAYPGSASSTTAISSARHSQRAPFLLGKNQGTTMRIRLRGVVINQRVECRWVRITYVLHQER